LSSQSDKKQAVQGLQGITVVAERLLQVQMRAGGVQSEEQTSQPYKPVQKSGSIADQWIQFYASGYQF
jgi:hypothetical protein